MKTAAVMNGHLLCALEHLKDVTNHFRYAAFGAIFNDLRLAVGQRAVELDSLATRARRARRGRDSLRRELAKVMEREAAVLNVAAAVEEFGILNVLCGDD